MKKLLPALAAALILGLTSTGLAAENNFFESLTRNWTSDSLNQMAEEIARSFSRNSTSKLERPEPEDTGTVKLSGKIEYTSSNATVAADGLKGSSSSDDYVFQLDALAKINTSWTANARIEAAGDFGSGENLDAKLPRVWVEGDYGNFNIRLGKMELLTNEGGLIWDTDFSGAHMTFGNVLKFSGMGGQISAKNLDDSVLDESAINGEVMGDKLKTTNYTNSL